MARALVEKPEHTGPAKKKNLPPEPSLPKGKDQSRLSRAPDCKEGIQFHRGTRCIQ